MKKILLIILLSSSAYAEEPALPIGLDDNEPALPMGLENSPSPHPYPFKGEGAKTAPTTNKLKTLNFYPTTKITPPLRGSQKIQQF